MAERAKIFRSGTGQVVVELPPSVRFPDDVDDVLVRCEGERVILESASGEWPKEFLEMLGTLDEDLERLPQTPIAKVRNPLD